MADFDAVCNRLAHGLSGQGIEHGDRVAILSRNSHAFAALRFAVARLGAVLVPVNFALTADEVNYILRHSGARMLCAAGDLAPTAEEAARTGTRVEYLVQLPPAPQAATTGAWIAYDTLLTDTLEEPHVQIASDDLAQIIYTSGTESRPKGAMLPHSAVLWQYVSCVVEGEMQASDVVLHAMPLYHCAQLDVCLGPAVYVGASNVIVTHPKPEIILPLIERHRVTSFFAPPTVWITLLRSPLFETCDLTSLQKGYYGAAIMPVEILQELTRRLPQTRFWNLYGQTEIAPLATMLGPDDQIRKAGSAGRPVLNVETRVVDTDGLPVEPGAVGEIVHRSPQLLTGYFQDAERTAEAFKDGWFHSGDLATVDEEGYITVVDRMKDMIQDGRRERRESGGGGNHLRNPGGLRGRHHRGAASSLDRGRCRRDRAAAGPDDQRRRGHGPLSVTARGVQGAEEGRVRGGASQEPERQGPEAESAGELFGSPSDRLVGSVDGDAYIRTSIAAIHSVPRIGAAERHCRSA